MISGIEESQASRVQTDVDFAAFLQMHAAALSGMVSDLKAVLELRNQATHANAHFDLDSVRKMAASCRRVLGCLYNGRKH